jgi:hypothetical protein
MQSLHLFVGIVLFNIMKKNTNKISHPFTSTEYTVITIIWQFRISFGFPTIYIYILSAWLFSIAISYTIVKKYYE